MKTLLATYFLLLVSAAGSQTIYTSIQKNKKTYPDVTYRFVLVQDSRSDRDQLGFIKKSGSPIYNACDFKKPLRDEVLGFLNNTFTNRNAPHQIVVRFYRFEIGHVSVDSGKDTGFVFLQSDLFLKRNDSLLFLYRYEHRFSENQGDIALTHSNRIKRALFLMLVRLNNFFPADGSNPKEYVSSSSSAPEARAIISPEISYQAHYDSVEKVNNYASPHVLMIGADVSATSENLLAYASVSSLFRLTKYRKTLLGFTLKYLGGGLYRQGVLRPDQSYSILSFNAGAVCMQQIKGSSFFKFEIQMMYGKERITTIQTVIAPQQQTKINESTVYSDLIGSETCFGIYFFKPSRSSAYFGADFLIRGTNSSVIENSVGLKINLGFKF